MWVTKCENMYGSLKIVTFNIARRFITLFVSKKTYVFIYASTVTQAPDDAQVPKTNGGRMMGRLETPWRRKGSSGK